MKKFITIIACLFIMLTLCACSNTSDKTTIRNIKQSKDSEEIIQFLDNKLQIFEIHYSDDVKSRTIQLWICHNGKWEKGGKIAGNIEDDKESIKLFINTDYVSIQSDGAKYKLYVDDVSFENLSSYENMGINKGFDVDLNKEYTLAAMYGSKQKIIPSITNNQTITSMNYDVAIAITITTSDEIMNIE